MPTYSLRVNGRTHEVNVDADTRLLWILRDLLGLTGTKYGCGEGQCRACTVLLDGNPVRSCQTDISDVAGRKIETIESLATERGLHPVQQAFIKEGAMQCGYCVPGMILATVGLLRRNPAPTKVQIIEALNGNICRCCGYVNILRAVQGAAQPNKEAK